MIVDSDDKVLAGIKEDGTVEWSVGVPTPVREELLKKADKEDGKSLIDSSVAESMSSDDNPEFLTVTTDSENKILQGIKSDGTTYIGGDTIVNGNVSIPVAEIESGDNLEYIQVTTDREDKIIMGIKNDGSAFNNAGLETPKIKTDSLQLSKNGMDEFKEALENSGFSAKNVLDWSDAPSLKIPTPELALLNITNDTNNATWPTSKTANMQYYMEFWDMNGNYFRKEIIFNAQGNSSMIFPKKNGSIDICNNNGWDDEDTFDLQIGDWVSQDSFHLKAFYTDFFRGTSFMAYKLADEIRRKRGILRDRAWKEKGLLRKYSFGPNQADSAQIDDLSLQIDNGARCQPDAFPCVAFLNGEFYGVYSFALKKHRDNYHMNKKKPAHIHIDGYSYASVIWGGNVGWGSFEIRNPKKLVYATSHGGYEYDADVAQAEIAGNTDGSTTYDAWQVGSYPIDKIVKHNGHFFINTLADNTAEPIYDKKNNGDDAPDFKNKTGCGWINCTNTIKVKEYIINLSKRIGQLKEMVIIPTSNENITLGDYAGSYNAENNFSKGVWVSDSSHYYMSLHSSNHGNPLSDDTNWMDVTTIIADIKEAIEKYFDVDSFIDYQIAQCATFDTDGFEGNRQYLSYDGERWAASEYDKDNSFGVHFLGVYTWPVRTTGGWGWMNIWGADSNNLNYPDGWIIKFYKKELKEVWDACSDIFTTEHIMGLFKDWLGRIGAYLEKEYEKWPDSPCNRDAQYNEEYWRCEYRLAGTAYDENTTYHVGDTCGIPIHPGYKLLFACVKENSPSNPQYPVLKTYEEVPYAGGCKDSMWRLLKFVERNFELENEFFSNL